MKDWFATLQPRERLILIAAATLLIPLLIYLLVWEPVSKEVTTLRTRVEAGKKQVAWLQKASNEARSLQASGTATTPNSSVSLITAIEKSATERNLRSYLKRIEPQGNNKISIDIDNAAFDDIIHWISELQTRYGATVAQFTAARSDQPGRVQARLVMTRES